MTPGAGSGPACAVDTQPAFPYVAPPPLAPLSTIVTSAPPAHETERDAQARDPAAHHHHGPCHAGRTVPL